MTQLSQQSQKVLSGCVVRNEVGEYLLVCEGNLKFRGLWSVPVGHAESGETLQQTAERETTEETGYTVRAGKELTLQDNQTPDYIVHIFTSIIIGGQLRVEPELLDVAWKSYAELTRMRAAGQLRAPWTWQAIQVVQQMSRRSRVLLS